MSVLERVPAFPRPAVTRTELDARQQQRAYFVRLTAGALMILGAVLFASSIYLDFSGVPQGNLSNLLSGALLLLLGWACRRAPLDSAAWAGLALLISIWTLLSPWLLGYPLATFWFTLFVASLLVVFAAWCTGEAADLRELK